MIALARASHFPPTVAVTAFTTALAVSSGRGWGSVAVAAAVLSGQLAVGWSNDYIDRDRDGIAGRTDKPIPSGEIGAGAVRSGAVIAALACVPLSLLSGWRAAVVHLVAVAVALTYNRWLKSTVLSVAPYVIAFGLLPAFVSFGLRGHPAPPAWAMLAGASLGAGAHFLNTLPDLRDDAVTGVRGLPHRLGATGSLLVGATFLGGATAIVALAPRGPLGHAGTILAAAGAAVVLAVVAAAAGGRARLAWRLSLVAAGVTVALYLVRGDSIS